jgi:MFS family permease
VLEALKSRSFRLLWLGQSVSMLGDGLVIVAIGLFVFRLTKNPDDTGVVLAAYSLPLILFLLLGGVVADRLPRRLVMIASDAVRGVAHLTLAVLIASGAIRIWHMVVIGVVFGISQAFFQPAYTGLVPQTVPEPDLQAAQALGGISRELAAVLGPALATVLVFTVGGAAAFALDGMTFIVSALTLVGVRPTSRGTPRNRAGLLRELWEGWTAVRERGWVWATVAAFSMSVLVALAPFWVLGPAVSRQVYGTEAVYGVSNVMWGVGTVLGALAAGRWHPRRPMLTGLLLGSLWPAQITLFAIGPPALVLFPATVLSGLGIGVFGVWWETALAQRIPAHLLSRVSAWDWLGSLAFLPLGYLLAGPVATTLGEIRFLVVGGIIGMGVLLLALVPRSTRQLTRLDPAPCGTADPGGAPTLSR